MKLHVKAKHFRNAPFLSYDRSPIAKAYQEATGIPCIEGINIIIEKERENEKVNRYRIEPAYVQEMYKEDFEIAVENNYDDTIIRIIDLKDMNPTTTSVN